MFPEVDSLFLLAMFSFGWGLSLATYHWFAARQGWSLGEVQANQTSLAVLIGGASMLVAVLFVLLRGYLTTFDTGEWVALLAGVALGLTWTSLLKVYSQISLFLAPLAAVFLYVRWWYY